MRVIIGLPAKERLIALSKECYPRITGGILIGGYNKKEILITHSTARVI